MPILFGSANAEYVLEVGVNTVSREYSHSITVLVEKRWDNKYVLGVAYLSPQSIDLCDRPDCQWKVASQTMLGVERLFTWHRFSAGFGLYYQRHLNRVSSAHVNIRTSLEYSMSDRIAVKYSHLSNNQTGEKILYCNDFYCNTGPTNTGVDTFLLVWTF